jgi:PKD repeat protein
LSWTGGDPDGDPVTYDVYFGTSSPPPINISNQSGTSYAPGDMQYATLYYWRIVAWDNHSVSSVGPLWNFTTRSEMNSPPNIPNSPIPRNGSIGISVNTDISWLGGDPDPGDTVSYDVYFGTSSSPPIKVHNQTTTSYDPGTMSYSTTYYWRIIAWDSQDNSTISSLFHFKTAAQSGGGEEPPQPPQNIKPIADASAGKPYRGLVNTQIRFDGSRSYDPDGNITSWLWDFGDNTDANGVTIYHSFLEAQTYTVSLTVTDDKGATDTDTTTCVIGESNRPPTKPTILGPLSGTKNTLYTYTASSTDPDNDPLQYSFSWEGSISQPSGFLPSGINYSVNHRWTNAGRYNLTVTVTDNQTESSSKITIYIDAVQTRGAGYLLDMDGDGIYDAFYSDETHQTVSIQRNGDSYFIDKDGDGHWEYVYNATFGLTSYQEPHKTPGYELCFSLCAIAVVILLSRKRKNI